MSRLLAEGCEGPAVHMHTDDFYGYIKKGYIPPWQEGSGAQNGTVINAAAACAGEYARGGYTVFVDGVIGPWFLGPWLELVMEGMDVRYIVLLPGEEGAAGRSRAEARERIGHVEDVRRSGGIRAPRPGYGRTVPRGDGRSVGRGAGRGAVRIIIA